MKNRHSVRHGVVFSGSCGCINSMDDVCQTNTSKLDGVGMAAPSSFSGDCRTSSATSRFTARHTKAGSGQEQKVINNPFWWMISFPATFGETNSPCPEVRFVAAQKHHRNVDRSMRNLEFPVNWDEVLLAYVGFPAFLKPHVGGG